MSQVSDPFTDRVMGGLPMPYSNAQVKHRYTPSQVLVPPAPYIVDRLPTTNRKVQWVKTGGGVSVNAASLPINTSGWGALGEILNPFDDPFKGDWAPATPAGALGGLVDVLNPFSYVPKWVWYLGAAYGGYNVFVKKRKNLMNIAIFGLSLWQSGLLNMVIPPNPTTGKHDVESIANTAIPAIIPGMGATGALMLGGVGAVLLKSMFSKPKKRSYARRSYRRRSFRRSRRYY